MYAVQQKVSLSKDVGCLVIATLPLIWATLDRLASLTRCRLAPDRQGRLASNLSWDPENILVTVFSGGETRTARRGRCCMLPNIRPPPLGRTHNKSLAGLLPLGAQHVYDGLESEPFGDLVALAQHLTELGA